jgi:hypothetical protein
MLAGSRGRQREKQSRAPAVLPACCCCFAPAMPGALGLGDVKLGAAIGAWLPLEAIPWCFGLATSGALLAVMFARLGGEPVADDEGTPRRISLSGTVDRRSMRTASDQSEIGFSAAVSLVARSAARRARRISMDMTHRRRSRHNDFTCMGRARPIIVENKRYSRMP